MLSHYVVHWDGYQAHLQAACEKQFLAENFVDVTLAVEAGLIKCHRVILSAASGYFQQLLSQHTACPHPIIFMRDMHYWEVIALVDFMYRGEVSVEASQLEQLMRSAHSLQIHGLSACLKACLQRTSSQAVGEAEGEDSQESGGSGMGGESEMLPEPEVQLTTALNKLSELNTELELRPISPSQHRNKRGTFPPLKMLQEQSVPTSQRNVVKEEIEFIEEKQERLSPIECETTIKIQDVFSERTISEEKAENSDDCVEVEEDSQPPAELARSDHNFRQYLLVRPVQGQLNHGMGTPSRPQTTCDYPLYKRYSPHVLEQALEDLHTGRFRSIRACARHHGIPMTTLRYRAKVHPKRPHWLSPD